jgi:hypothetical protein
VAAQVALGPDFPEQQDALGLCRIEQALEQDEQLACLGVDFDVDGVMIEAVGRQPGFDFAGDDGIGRELKAFCRI